MRVTANMFWGIMAFFLIVGGAYGIWGLIVTHEIEWVGAVALTLCAVLSGFLAFYIGRTHAAQGGELPEDRADASIDDGDPEVGHFSPWSWWPLFLAFGIGLVFLGIAIGFWIAFIGAPIVAIGIIGWTYEYYRNNFAR